MRLAVFGETNRTKHYLVKRALDAGYDVSVLERAKPSSKKRKNLTIFEGDIHDKHSMQRVMQQADAVLCLLQNPRQALDDTTRNIVEDVVSCMQENFVKRLVVFSCMHDTSTGRATQSNKLHRLLSLFTDRFDEPANVGDILRPTGLDWTIVGHPPAAGTLHDDMAESKPDPEEFRKNLAKHMVSQVTDVAYLRGTLQLPA